jgi:hypothetical protein
MGNANMISSLGKANPSDPLRVFYCSAQLYTVHLARRLQKEWNWQPVYWFTSPHNHAAVAEEFPSAIRHWYVDSVKGMPVEEFRDRPKKDLPPEIAERYAFQQIIAFHMMDRNDSNSDSFKFRQRQAFFYRQFRYWQTVLLDAKIDAVVFEEEPHQPSDYILYHVCEYLRIPTLLFVRTLPELGIIPMYRYEEGSPVILNRYRASLESYTGGQVALNERAARYFEVLAADYSDVRKLHLWDQLDELEKDDGVLSRLTGYGKRVYAKVAKLFEMDRIAIHLRAITGIKRIDSDQKVKGKEFFESHQGYFAGKRFGWRTKKRKKGNLRRYEEMATPNLDLEQPYIFCALQFQPEKSTCPMGGAYVDQVLMIEALSAALPRGWLIYVKDHPSQYVNNYRRYGDFFFRGEAYYERILSLGNTRLVSLDAEPFPLIDSAKAVASIGGTILWEAVVRGTPTLCFAYSWMRSCEGVFDVRHSEDLRKVMREVESGLNVELEKVKLFAKSISDLGFRAGIGGSGLLDFMKLSPEENADAHFGALELLLKEYPPEEWVNPSKQKQAAWE